MRCVRPRWAAPSRCFRPVLSPPVPQILACLLTEQRVVFFSSSWALLTLVAECFVAYLHPLQWQHTFVPILPGQMLDFLMAPTSFLMGCHLGHFEEVSKVSTHCWIQGAVTRASWEDAWGAAGQRGWAQRTGRLPTGHQRALLVLGVCSGPTRASHLTPLLRFSGR